MADQAGPIAKPAIARDAPLLAPAEAAARGPVVQALAETGQMLNARPALVAQRALADRLSSASPVQRAPAPNRTGLPDRLKQGVEALSGVAMDEVRVHRNSSEPAQLQAHAYAQGSDIHLAPGQDHHLPHEAWHVVQQKQGRVAATRQLKQVGINDDPGLEAEADRMGARALAGAAPAPAPAPLAQAGAPLAAVQRYVHKYGDAATDQVPEKYLVQARQVASDIDAAVGEAVGIIGANPTMHGMAASGYLDAWVVSYNLYVSSGLVPPFFYARYGYAVETLATRTMRTKSYSLVTVTDQVALGATRPDFVVRMAKAPKADVAWLDITSAASAGHVLAKQHSGWKSRPYVAEILYHSPDMSDFSKHPNLTKKQKETLASAARAAEQSQADYQRGYDQIAVLLDNALDTAHQKKGAGLADADVRAAVGGALKTLFGSSLTMPQAGQILRNIDEIKVGDTTDTGASWARAFGGQKTKGGQALIENYGKHLRLAEEASSGKDEGKMMEESEDSSESSSVKTASSEGMGKSSSSMTSLIETDSSSDM